MKNAVFAGAAALAAGLFLGHFLWSPDAAELARLRAEHRRIQKALADLKARGEMARAKKTPGPSAPAAGQDRPPDAPAGAPPDSADVPPQGIAEPIELDPGPEHFELWRQTWEARQAESLAALAGRLGLDADGEAKLKGVFAEMSRRVGESVEALAALLAEEDHLTRELEIRGLGDFAFIVASTYDALRELVDEAHQDAVPDIDFEDFIDPDAMRPLAGLGDKFNAPGDAEDGEGTLKALE